MIADEAPSEPTLRGGRGGRILARDGLAMAVSSVVTVAAQWGVYAAATSAGSGPREALLATLAVTVVWVALAGAVLAASGADTLGAMFRGGCLADAAGVGILVLTAFCPVLTFLATVQVYCTLVGMAMLAVAVSRLARRPAGRYALAVATASVLVVSLASPWWVGGAMRVGSQPMAEAAAAVAVYVNPFYAVTAAVADTTRFVWHEAPVLYRITRIGDYAAAPAPLWWASSAIHAAVALVAGAVAAARHRGVRPSRPSPREEVSQEA